MIEFLQNIDASIFLALNGPHCPFFDSFMTMFTGRYIWIPMYLTVLWILFSRKPRLGGGVFLIMLILAIAATDQLCASLIRPAVERLRPSNPENPLSDMVYVVGGYRGGSYGFPSCHAANSFAFATFIALTVRRGWFAAFIFGWALLNTYTRIYLGVHYPGDILAGALIGSAVAAVCYFAASRLAKFAGRDATPEDDPILNIPGPQLMVGVFAATLIYIVIASI